jgi:hypothetical protein
MATYLCNFKTERRMAKAKNEVYAAIAMALHEFKGNNVHDRESDMITIKCHHTEWNAHYLQMTKVP